MIQFFHYYYWLVEPTHLKNMLVKMGSSSPIFGVEKKKYLKPSPRLCLLSEVFHGKHLELQQIHSEWFEFWRFFLAVSAKIHRSTSPSKTVDLDVAIQALCDLLIPSVVFFVRGAAIFWQWKYPMILKFSVAVCCLF